MSCVVCDLVIDCVEHCDRSRDACRRILSIQLVFVNDFEELYLLIMLHLLC